MAWASTVGGGVGVDIFLRIIQTWFELWGLGFGDRSRDHAAYLFAIHVDLVAADDKEIAKVCQPVIMERKEFRVLGHRV